MDISDWGMADVMQLPDCAFGQIWPVAVTIYKSTTGQTYHISETAFPDECVVWELSVHIAQATTGFLRFELALGDQVPANDAEFAVMENFMPELHNVQAGGDRYLYTSHYMGQSVWTMRRFVRAQGRRLVCRANNYIGGAGWPVVAVMISSVPKELPRWMALLAHRL